MAAIKGNKDKDKDKDKDTKVVNMGCHLALSHYRGHSGTLTQMSLMVRQNMCVHGDDDKNGENV